MNMSMGVFIATHCQGEVGAGVAFTVNPSLTGDAIVGETLTVSLGTATGATALAGSLRHVSDDTEVDTFTEDGTYEIQDTDFGEQLYLYVTATGAGGVASAESAATAAVDFAWLFRDQFTTDEAAPLPALLNADPGPGSWDVTDSGSAASITGGKIVVGAGGVGANDPRIVSSVAFDREAGRALVFKDVTRSVARAAFGWRTPAGAFEAAVEYAPNNIYDGTTGVAILSGSGTSDDLAFVLNETSGFDYYYKSGGVGDWILGWVGLIGTEAAIHPHIRQIGATAQWSVSEIAARDIGGAFLTAQGRAIVNEASPVSGAVQVSEANAIHHFAFTLSGSPSAGDEVGIDYRIQDASNKWRAILKRDAGNTAWDFRVRTVTAGVEATPAGWTDVTGVGTPTLICVLTDTNTHMLYTLSGTWTKRGSTITNAYLATEPDVAAVHAAGTTAASLRSYARSSALYSALDFT